MELTYIKVFVDWLDALEEYGDAERGRLFTALLEYGKTGEAKKLSGNERYIFPMMRNVIDRQRAEYEKTRSKNAENGRKGGLAKASQTKRPLATASDRQPDVANCSQEKEEEKDKDQEKEDIRTPNGVHERCGLETTPQMPRVNYRAIVEDYNRTCTRLPQCKSISEDRKKAIKARLRTYSVEQLHTIFVKAQNSDFLCGKNRNNFTANFDWLMKDANAAKTLDGLYDDRKGGGDNGTAKTSERFAGYEI